MFCLTDRHPAAYLARELTRVTTEWDVHYKVVVCVTDNASNIVTGLRDHLHWGPIPCFTRVLNVIVRAAFKEVKHTKQKI